MIEDFQTRNACTNDMPNPGRTLAALLISEIDRPFVFRRGNEHQLHAQALPRGRHAQRARAPGEDQVLTGPSTYDGRAALLSRVVNAQVSLVDKFSQYN